MKKLYTSNYARNGNHPKALSISAIKPEYYPNVGWFPLLAPSKELLYALLDDRISLDQYEIEFLSYLETLNPVDVVAKLEENSILLCYEKPTDKCHRHLVRDWLNASGVAEVSELYNDAEKAKMGLDVVSMSDLFEF